MDGRVGNMRADDDRFYLVDFGSATSPRFDLSDAERGFALRYAGHDADHAAMRLVNWPVWRAGAGQRWPCRPHHVRAAVRERRYPSGHAGSRGVSLTRHARTAARMNDFCRRLFDGDIHAKCPTHG